MRKSVIEDFREKHGSFTLLPGIDSSHFIIDIEIMKISVALATYNGGAFIEDQLQSILEQSRSVDEVIIHDDCSSDGTAKKVHEFIEKHSLWERWKFSVNKTNLGFEKNFKETIAECTGDIVFFSDQDDIWVPDRVEKMVPAMEADAKIQVLYSHFVWFRELPPKKTHRSDNTVRKINFTKKNRNLAAPGCTMCVRMSFVRGIEAFWIPGWAHDDAVWNFSVAQDGLYEMNYISLLRRDHETRSSGHVGHEKEKRIAYLKSFETISESMYDFCLAKNDYNKARIYAKSKKMAVLRLKLVQQKKLRTLFPLLAFINYYPNKRSYFMEAIIAMRRK